MHHFIRNSFFIVILAPLFILGGCSSTPRYSEIWVHSKLQAAERTQARDMCMLKAIKEQSYFLDANPQQDKYSTQGALNNFTRQLKSGKVYALAIATCMRSKGFRKEKRCIANCDLEP